MKFFEGDVKNAISSRKTFCSAFIIFVESKDPESVRFRQVLDEENTIPVKEYVAFRISPSSETFKYFRSIYHDVPVPCLMIIGSNGQPIRTLSSCYPKEELYAGIKEALDIHKADSTSSNLSDRLQNDSSVQILLKLPKGETALVEFSEVSCLKEVRVFVKESLQVKDPFQMINPFPRKIFSLEEEDQTLVDLRLNPTSTILVVPIERKPWTPQCISDFVTVLFLAVARVYGGVKEWLRNLIPRSRR